MIIGGGITGLMAAYDLERLTNAEIDLYEASPRLGGKLVTEHPDGYLIEAGPDCFFSRKPGVMELVQELGLENELISPLQKEFSILLNGQLHPVAAGLVSFTNLDLKAVDNTPLLSEEGKARVKLEKIQPKGDGKDESIRSFFTRRFGEEYTRTLAEPLLAGTHGGDPSLLSMRCLYPMYLGLEQEHGSISQSTPAALGTSNFLSFQKGMGALVMALQSGLNRTQIHLHHQVSRIAGISADQILVGVPANCAATLFKNCAPEVARNLAEIEHRSCAIITLAFSVDAVETPLTGTGFLVPSAQNGYITGATWSSKKWSSRAPSDEILMRIFVGGDRSKFADQSDRDMIQSVLIELFGILSLCHAPLWSRVRRWIDALPQYTLGHDDRIAAIQSELSSGRRQVFIAGTSFGGVGVPDCLRQGRAIAKQMERTL